MALGQVLVNFIANTSSFERGTKTASKNLTAFQKTTIATQKALMRFGSTLAAGVGFYAINRAIQASVREFAAFERQMANVSTMLDDQTMSYMPRYSRAIRQMSKDFGEGTETLSKGLYDILSASIDASQALDVLRTSVKAATAGLTDTGIAADVITTVIKSYGLEANRAGDVSDKLFAIVKRGKTTFAELAPNIGKIASLAAQVGVSFDDLGAAISTMTRAGVQTEIAITSLRATMLAFLKPQADAIKLAEKYGLELNSSTLRKIGFVGVTKKLAQASAEELAVIIPTSRAIAGYAATLRNVAGMADDYEHSLNALGLSEEAYQKIANTTDFQLRQFHETWNDIKRVIGETIAIALVDWLKDIKKYAEDTAGAISMIVKGLVNLNKVTPAYWIKKKISDSGFFSGGKFPTDTSVKVTDQAAWQRWLAFQKKTEAENKRREILAPPAPAQTGPQIYNQESLDKMRQLQRQLEIEIELTGKLGDARQHAKMKMEFETAALETYGNQQDVIKQKTAEFESQLKKLESAQKLAEIATDIGNAFTNAFDRAILEGEKLRNVIKALLNDIARSIIHQGVSVPIGQFISEAIGTGISGLGSGGTGIAGSSTSGGKTTYWGSGNKPYGSFHQGGIAGFAKLFNQAPRLHNGLRANEFPAILERGETVIPKGGANNVTMNFNSPDAQSAYQLFYNNRRALATVLNGTMNENATLRRSQR